MHDKGTYTNAFVVYEGEFRNGKKHGRGVFRSVTGARYEGEHANGQKHGHGNLFVKNGGVYRGEFRDGLPHGRCSYTWPNGMGSFTGCNDQGRPTTGVLEEPDGREYDVTYSSECGLFWNARCRGVDPGWTNSQSTGSGTHHDDFGPPPEPRTKEPTRRQRLKDHEMEQRQRNSLAQEQREIEERERNRRAQEQRETEELEQALAMSLEEVVRERTRREQELLETEELEQALAMSREEVRVSEHTIDGMRKLLESMLSGGPPCEVSADLALKWTNSFSVDRKIGEGAFGDVFEGQLRGGIDQRQVKVAVKRLKPTIRLQGNETEHRAALSSIRREIHVLSTFFHPNIIRLLGYTSTSSGMTQEMCLIYELAQCGSLDKMLTDDAKAQDLSWRSRVRITGGIARALNYLHCHDTRAPAYHRDVKSANIVLDQWLNPKLIDCGLSKFIPNEQRHGTIISTRGAALGTPGYMCPTYQRTGAFDAKSEIFSFGIVLLEMLTGRVQGYQQLPENDLYGVYIEEEMPLADGLDARAGEWPTEGAVQLEQLTRDCLEKYKKRIESMLVVKRQLVSLEKESCQATAEEKRLERLTHELQREVEALRLQAEEQEAARQEAQRTCNICFDESAEGVGCEGTVSHFICCDCAPSQVQTILQQLNPGPHASEERLERHRAQGGRIKCVQPDCESWYPETGLARALPDDVFRQYRAAQDAVVEQRLFQQLQERFQQQLAEFQRSSGAAHSSQDDEATAEFLRRQYPNAVQCPNCGAGPVIPENCYDLQAHHGESTRGGRISNACPSCGFFSRERGDWVRWNGHMR